MPSNKIYTSYSRTMTFYFKAALAYSRVPQCESKPSLTPSRMDVHYQYRKPTNRSFATKSIASATLTSFAAPTKVNGAHHHLESQRKMVRFVLYPTSTSLLSVARFHFHPSQKLFAALKASDTAQCWVSTWDSGPFLLMLTVNASAQLSSHGGSTATLACLWDLHARWTSTKNRRQKYSPTKPSM